MARLLPSRFFSLIVRNMIWPRIDWKIWFLLVCFYREEIKFNAKKLLLSSRTWLMSWEREEKKVPVRVNSEEVNKNPIWELKRNTRQMVYHPSKYLGCFPVWIHWFDRRNVPSLICAALFCRGALTTISSRDPNCVCVVGAGAAKVSAGGLELRAIPGRIRA